MDNNMSVIKLNKFKQADLTGDLYWLYREIRVWCDGNQIKYQFKWENTGAFLPDEIIMDRESATAFKLIFDV